MIKRGWSIAAVLLVAILGVVLSPLIGVSVPEESRISYAFATMGTRAECTFYDCDREQAEAAFAAVEREFDRVAKACNLYDPESELSRLNRTADREPFVCSPLLWAVLTEARRANAASSGAFDISVKPLMDLWGFYRKRQKIPSPEELAAALNRVGMEKVEWDDLRRAVRFRTPGMALDLGGIAKGYALDLAAAAVRELGIKSGVIDLGGNLYLLPEPPPEREDYRIGIRSPSGTGCSGEVLELKGPCAVSTSGSYERFVVLEGKRYGHVVDPVTGDAPYLNRSATAVAPTGIEADWLSSAAFLRGEELIPQLKRFVPGAEITITAADK
jgi:thiamine biosynthesis lipoprotein